jgi:two-component system, NarL family, invasion response regulator UvrY
VARVYLVDDHLIVRDALSALLAANGHQVLGAATDMTQALAEIRELDPDVVVLDLRLGMRSGLDLLVELRRRDLRCKTIVTTMSELPRDVADAMRQGADAYVLKGSPTSELLQAIAAVVQGRRYFVGRVAELAAEALATPPQDEALASLSMRERQVMLLVVHGRSSAEVAAELHLSAKTVDTYRSRLMAKLGVPDVQGLVRFAVRAGLIDAEGG